MASQVADERWLGSFVFRHKRAVVLALLCGAVGGFTAALEPYVIGRIVDLIRQQASIDQLMPLIFAMIGLAAITVVAFFGQRAYSGEIAYSVNFNIRKTLFDNMLTLEPAFYQQYPTGDLISRMHNDIVLIWQLLAMGFMRAGSAVTTLIMTFILLASVSLPLTLIVFVVLSISTTFQLRVGRVIAPLFEKVQDQAGVVAALVQDAVSGIQTIKTAGKEAGVVAQFRSENIEYRRRWLFFKRRYEPVGMLPNMISETTAAIVVLVGGVMTVNGAITVGDFTSFLIYLAMISTVLLQAGTVYQRLQQTRGALSRLTPLLKDAEIKTEEGARPVKQPRGDIHFENVTVELDGVRLLNNISVEISAGSVVAVVGPTGCGKTLLVNLLARVMDVTDGQVMVDGTDVRELDLDDLRQMIAYVPQSTFLFSQKLHENVRMGRDDIEDAALHDAIHTSRLSNDLAQLPNGLDTMVGERGVMLSGGQKQRVAIARAIVRDPSILILDDALSSVDTQTAADILSDLRKVLKTRTSLIIAHRIATVRDADHIIVMDDGRIVEQGTHWELLAKAGMYAQMVERELEHTDLDEQLAGAEEKVIEDVR